jgi:hypothetical protein
MKSLCRSFILVLAFAVTGLFVHAETESAISAHHQNQLVKVVKKSAKKHRKHKKKKAE